MIIQYMFDKNYIIFGFWPFILTMISIIIIIIITILLVKKELSK